MRIECLPARPPVRSSRRITGWDGNVAEDTCIVQLHEFPTGDLSEAGRKALGNLSIPKDHLSQFALEGPDHVPISPIERITPRYHRTSKTCGARRPSTSRALHLVLALGRCP